MTRSASLSAGLLAQMRELQDRALQILASAEQSGDSKLALQALREARANLALLARLIEGDLVARVERLEAALLQEEA